MWRSWRHLSQDYSYFPPVIELGGETYANIWRFNGKDWVPAGSDF
jgi:hypothetical protein